MSIVKKKKKENCRKILAEAKKELSKDIRRRGRGQFKGLIARRG